MNISCQRALFDIPREVAYFNCAYMSPLLKSAHRAGVAGLSVKSAPWTISTSHFFDMPERARALFARIVGADADGVAIVPATSYGMNAAARNLPIAAGSSVLMLRDQFPSNVYPWREAAGAAGAQIRTVALRAGECATEAVLAALDENVAVATLPQVLWTTGAKLDLARISARCREVGAALALDLTQSIAVMEVDFARIQPDFAVASTYKWLLGPYSLGFLYVAPKWRDGAPLEHGWIVRDDARNMARLVDYKDGYAPGARRYDMGERSNFALMPAAIAAMEQILDWGVSAIGGTLARKTAALAARAAELGLVGPPADLRGPHYLALALPQTAPPDLLQRLAQANVYVSQRGENLRITPHLYNDEEDGDRLIRALAAALRA